MEFIETLSFLYPHIDRAACTNFSTRTVELRPSERREILPFPFPFPFCFLFLLSFSMNSFSFPFSFFSFFLTNSFLFFCSFICFFLFSPPPPHFFFLISFSLLLAFLLPLESTLTVWVLSLFAFLLLSHFLLFGENFGFLSFLGSTLTVWVKGGNFLLIASCHLCGLIRATSSSEPHGFTKCHSLGVPCGIPSIMPCGI